MIANLLSVSVFRPILGILHEWNNEVCDLSAFYYVLRFSAFIIYQYISAFLSGIILLSRYYILYIHPCTARYLSCFHLLATLVMCSAAVNISVQVRF